MSGIDIGLTSATSGLAMIRHNSSSGNVPLKLTVFKPRTTAVYSLINSKPFISGMLKSVINKRGLCGAAVSASSASAGCVNALTL